MIPLSKTWGWLAIASAVFGALNTAEILQIVGPKVGAIVAVMSTVVAAVSRALVDRDGDGKPDWAP